MATHVTETIYASVRQEDVGDRIVDSIDPRYARHAHRGQKKPVVATIKRSRSLGRPLSVTRSTASAGR
jgi:hypothetical protein